MDGLSMRSLLVPLTGLELKTPGFTLAPKLKKTAYLREILTFSVFLFSYLKSLFWQ